MLQPDSGRMDHPQVGSAATFMQWTTLIPRNYYVTFVEPLAISKETAGSSRPLKQGEDVEVEDAMVTADGTINQDQILLTMQVETPRLLKTMTNDARKTTRASVRRTE